MNTGTPEIRQVIEGAVPLSAGEQRKGWFHRAGKQLEFQASRLKSIYYDPRCRLTSAERTRLQVISDHLQKVHFARQQLAKEGDIHAELRQLRAICEGIVQRLDQTFKKTA